MGIKIELVLGLCFAILQLWLAQFYIPYLCLGKQVEQAKFV